MAPIWFLARYPNHAAVLRQNDFELIEDFRFAVMEIKPSSCGGVVTGWMSRELMRRGIRA
jgi:hypothetical protein